MIAFFIAAVSALLLAVTLSNVLSWPRLKPVGQDFIPPRVSVLIPARNEAANLPACLEAVLAQSECVSEILVYDDHSTDGTAAVIAAYAQRTANIHLVAAQPLPAGWCGKNFACAQLAEAAASTYLLFLDADARLLPGAIKRMAAEMLRRRLTLLSCWPGLEMHSFWEKALMPLLNMVVFSTYPAMLALVFPSRFPSLGLAHGACMMFERATYFRLGGHTAVKDQIFEDTRLAQRWRAHGAPALGLDGQDIVRVRMYESFAGIWSGFQKNFFPAFQHRASFWLFIILHCAVYLAPFPLFLMGQVMNLPHTRIYALATACILGMRFLLAWRFCHPLWSVLLHPFSEIILLALGLSSYSRCQSGRGVNWKGRNYHQQEQTQ